MRIVIDTNVVISAFLVPQSEAWRILHNLQQSSTVLASKATMEELTDVLFRPKFDRYLSRTRRFSLLSEYVADIFEIEVTTEIHACRDPKDDKFLSLAVSGNADYIITGDADLLVLNPFQGITIVTPATYLGL